MLPVFVSAHSFLPLRVFTPLTGVRFAKMLMGRGGTPTILVGSLPPRCRRAHALCPGLVRAYDTNQRRTRNDRSPNRARAIPRPQEDPLHRGDGAGPPLSHPAHPNWCDENDVDNLNELTGRNLHEFRLLYLDILQDVSVLDPAVASGAFLLAAQDVLLDVYLQCLEFFEELEVQGQAWELSSRTREELEHVQSRKGGKRLYAKRKSSSTPSSRPISM